jgi:hypothetical protein
MGGYRLYLDDIREPKTKGWLVVRSYEDFVQIIEKEGIPDEISFDHDLGWDEKNNCERKSGYDCAKWLVNKSIVIENFNVHSANPVGAEQIKSLLNNYKKFAQSTKEGKYNFTFQERSKLATEELEKQPPVSLEEAKAQIIHVQFASASKNKKGKPDSLEKEEEIKDLLKMYYPDATEKQIKAYFNKVLQIMLADDSVVDTINKIANYLKKITNKKKANNFTDLLLKERGALMSKLAKE